MKVLFTHELFPPDLRGGGEMAAFEAAKALMARGIEVRVLTTGNPRVMEYEGIPTERLPISRYRMNLATAEIARAAADADVIQTFSYHACLPSLRAGRRLNKPVVCVIGGLFGRLWREMKPFPAGWAWQAWERFQIRSGFDCLLFMSDYSRQQGQRMGAVEIRSRVLYPGIEADKFQPAGDKEDVVLFTGKFERRKGVFEVLQVARALPEVRFRMYGWGPEEPALRRSAPSNLQVRTYTDSSGLPDMLGRARICLLPSKAETFGFALVQAMASGCAIISSIPLEFAGRRVGAEDTPAMIEAVRQLWQDRAASLDAGRRNVELSRQYTWDRFAAGLVELYEQLLRERRQRQ
jgi:glycosyltransferase involved in cell wall biosynthesis